MSLLVLLSGLLTENFFMNGAILRMLKNLMLWVLMVYPAFELCAQHNFEDKWMVCEATDTTAVVCGVANSMFFDTIEGPEFFEMAGDTIVAASVQGGRKYPVLAAALSALLPGTGQLYVSNGEKGWGMLALHCLIMPLANYAANTSSFPVIKFILGHIFPHYYIYLLDGVLVVCSVMNAIEMAKRYSSATENPSRRNVIWNVGGSPTQVLAE